MLDWTTPTMTHFRAIARWDAEQAAKVRGDGAVAVLDQGVMDLREKMAEVGIDSRDPAALYYFVLGAHAQWAVQLTHAITSCGNPGGCLPAYVAHSANANVSWRASLREMVNAVPGIPAEPEARAAQEYDL